MSEEEFDEQVRALSLHAEFRASYLFAYPMWVGRKLYYEFDDIRWLDAMYWIDARSTGSITNATQALLWLEHIKVEGGD